MVGISRRPRCQSRSPRRRQNGRPHHPALGAPRLLQSQDLGLGRLSRPAPQAPPDLSRRVRLPLHPPPYPACRIPFLARHRRSPPAPDLQHVGLTGSKGISLYVGYFIMIVVYIFTFGLAFLTLGLIEIRQANLSDFNGLIATLDERDRYTDDYFDR